MANTKSVFDAVLILSAIDRATRVINQMANNAIVKLNKIQKGADKFANSSFAFGRNAAIAGTAIAAPLIYATNEAIKFEDKMADVSKVLGTGFEKGSVGLGKVSDQVKQTSLYLGVSAQDSAMLYANLSQGGIATEQLADVAKIAGEIGIAFGVSSDIAADSFVKMQNALGTTVGETKKVSDVINFLSDRTAANATDILEFMAAGGAGVARGYGMAGQEVAAFGTALISVGKSGAEASTIMERFAKGMMKNKEARAIFEGAGGGAKGLVSVLKEGASLDPTKQFAYFQNFGEYGNDIRLLANNMGGTGGLLDSLKAVSDATNYSDSVTKEFQSRQRTTAEQINKMKASVGVLSIELGNALLPAITAILEKITPLIKKFSDYASAHPRIIKYVGAFAAGLAALSFAASGFAFIFGGVAKAISMVSTVMSLFSATTRAATLAQWGINAAALTNPYVLLTIGIIALIAAVALMVIYFDEIWAAIKNVWEESSTLGKVFLVLIGIMSIAPIILLLIAAAIRAVIDNWDAISKFFEDYVNLVQALPVILFDAGVNIITSIIDGMKSKASDMIKTVSDIAQKIRDFFPFSPAKRGPLMDIHKIKLVETIANSIKPAPLVNAVSGVAAMTMAALPGQSTNGSFLSGQLAQNSHTGVTINYNPQVSISGPVTESQTANFLDMLNTHKNEIERMVAQAQQNKNRKAF